MRNHYALFLGALGFWLGNANPVWHMPLLCLLFPVCLAFLGRWAASPLSALRLGWICSLVGSSAALYWLAVPVHLFGGLPLALAIPCSVAIGAYVGLYDGLFALLAYQIRKETPGRRALMLGLGWFLLEWLRGWVFTGFPWLGLATALAPWTFAVQGASVVGSYGLAGVLAGLACMLASGVFEREQRRLAVAAAAGFALLTVFGLWRLYAEPLAQGEPVRVTIVQGNVDQNVKWEPGMQRNTLANYLELSTTALKASPAPSLLVWPETSMPFDYARHDTLSPLLRQFAASRQTTVLFGAVGREAEAGREARKGRSWRTTNRAHLISPAGDAGWYEKEHLVPFGEYAPAWLDFDFLGFLLEGVGNFSPGRRTGPLDVTLPASGAVVVDAGGGASPVPSSGAEVVPVPTTPAPLAPARETPVSRLVLGVLICYETVFPELARTRVAEGADVLINISNDAWFGRTAAPAQHLHLTLLRAVEQGRHLVRSTNTGISAFIDPYGRLRSTSDLFVATLLTEDIRPVNEHTLFFLLEPWLAPAAALLLALLGFCPLRRRNLSHILNR